MNREAVHPSDQRISAADGERYVYADAVVVCGGVQTEADTTDVLRNPSVVVNSKSASSTTAASPTGRGGTSCSRPAMRST